MNIKKDTSKWLRNQKRKHHNNYGKHQLKTGSYVLSLKRLADQLKIPFKGAL